MWQQKPTEGGLALKTATVHSAQGVSLGCALLNLSRSGACLLVRQSSDVPDEFELRLDHPSLSFGCSVIWRSERRIGVKFENPLTDREHASLNWTER